MWKDKKVLITGINGFIASHLAKDLEEKGAEIWGIEYPGEKSKHTLIDCDLTNKGQTLKAISGLRPDIIFHLGGQAIPSKAKDEPHKTFEANVTTTLNLLESIKSTKNISFIYASTREVYGDSKNLPFLENHQTKPNSIYSLTKITADNLTKLYHSSYGLPVAILRASNVYGPGDSNLKRIIPKAIESAISSKVLKLYGNGLIFRDYVYIKDLIKAYLLLGESIIEGKNQGEIFNISEGTNHSIKEIIEKIKNISEEKFEVEFDSQETTPEDISYASSEKAKKILGWVPETNIDQGLKLTYDWYNENRLHPNNVYKKD